MGNEDYSRDVIQRQQLLGDSGCSTSSRSSRDLSPRLRPGPSLHNSGDPPRRSYPEGVGHDAEPVRCVLVSSELSAAAALGERKSALHQRAVGASLVGGSSCNDVYIGLSHRLVEVDAVAGPGKGQLHASNAFRVLGGAVAQYKTAASGERVNERLSDLRELARR